MSTQSKKSNAPALIAWHVGQPKEEGGKGNWRRIGAAWKNRKGGFQLRLEAMPLTGDLVLLPPRKDGASKTKGAA
jgi:hypothetical protein